VQSLNPYGFKDFFYNTAERSSQADLHNLSPSIHKFDDVFIYSGLCAE